MSAPAPAPRSLWPGWFSRKHGLTCDNFVSLELVLATGEVIEVSAGEHPELFWALRGGGAAKPGRARTGAVRGRSRR